MRTSVLTAVVLLVLWASVGPSGCSGDKKKAAADGDVERTPCESNSDCQDAALFCAPDGFCSPYPDGDDDEQPPAGLPFGATCASNKECSSLLCFPTREGNFCSMTCASDETCSAELAGAICLQIQGSNICFPPRPDGDDDGDHEVESDTCTPGDHRCNKLWVEKCLEDGKTWEQETECGRINPLEICDKESGQCKVMVLDGDTEEGDRDTLGCGDSTQIHEPITRRAEDLFRQAWSTPSEKALVIDSLNPSFSDGTYVGMMFPPPGDPGVVGSELVFRLNVNSTWTYTFLIDFVCGNDWGMVGLYLDDATTPFLLSSGSDRTDLYCNPGAYKEKLLKKVPYLPVCLEAGEHKLKVRVVGAHQDSEGFSIGVDYFAALPED